MAVRTDVAGIKNKRKVGVISATFQPGSTRGKPLAFHDQLHAELLAHNRAQATPGPAAHAPVPKRNRRGVSIEGRKKAPSQMHVKRKGGPHTRSRLHGG